MKKIAIILTSLLLANTAMAGAVETVSYRCIGKKPVTVTYDLGGETQHIEALSLRRAVTVTYDLGGETQATAKIRLDGRLRTLVYSVDESNTESMTFKKGPYTLFAPSVGNLRTAKGMFITKDTYSIVNGQNTPVSKMLYKDCSPR